MPARQISLAYTALKKILAIHRRTPVIKPIPPPVRLGLIGLGGFCSNYHIPNLLRRNDIALTAVCDTDPQALARRHERLKPCVEFSDYRQLLTAGLVDGVVISTPNIFHCEQAKLALENGIHALVDKPLAMDAEQAAVLVRTSQSSQRLLMTAFTRHFMASTEYVRRQLARGAAGPLQLITAVQRRHLDRQPQLNGGIFLCRTVHLTDAIPWISGRAVVRAHGSIQRDPTGRERFAAIALELAGGLPVQIHVVQESDTYQDEITVYGSRQSFRLERQRLFSSQKNGTWSAVEDLAACGTSTDHFVEAMQGIHPAPGAACAHPHGADGLRALQVLEAIVQSNRRGAPVEIPHSPDAI